VEKTNDLLVVRRQKGKGMHWSGKMSDALVAPGFCLTAGCRGTAHRLCVPPKNPQQVTVAVKIFMNIVRHMGSYEVGGALASISA
jgi:hypothetical protein